MLAVRGLTVAIGGRAILSGVDLDVPAGGVLGLVGESGSGKSTAALAIAGLLPAGATISGSIALEGRELIGANERAMRGLRGRAIGTVFQEPATALNPLMTIGRQVAEVFAIHRVPDATAATLARVGLGDLAERYPHQLSGGQRQRAAIAMAVALAPRLIVADEPTTALDTLTQAEVLALLAGLAREGGAALLLISHDLAVVARLADRVAVLRDGRVVEAGPTAALLAAPREDYTKALIAAASHAPARVAADPAAPPLIEARALTRRHGRATVLDAASLTIRAGESVGVVGGSGSGKSTLLRLMLALERPSDGMVLLEDAPLTGTPAQRRAIQPVFQDPAGSFDPRWRVGRVVGEPLHLTTLTTDERAARVGEALESVGLAATDAARHPADFSGGQRQRIAIARALVVRPRLLALDEAVSALDPTTRAGILNLLARLQASGVALLFVSHDLGVVRRVTDRVVVLQAGRIVEEGPTERLFSAPAHAYTRALIDAAPELP